MAKNRKGRTPEEIAAQQERSRHFYALLSRRQARDEELRAEREKADQTRK